jgi:hypothetical protein
MTDFFNGLEQQLVDKSRELSAEAETPRTSSPRIRRWHVAIVVAMLAIGGSAVADNRAWEPLLGKPGMGIQPTISNAAPPRAQLSTLGVLRRKAGEPDRGESTATALRFIGRAARGANAGFIRLLRVSPGQRPAVLVPVERYSLALAVRGRWIDNALCVVVLESVSRAGAKFCFSGAQVSAGSAFSAASAQYVFGLVPDGVARVTFRYAQPPPVDAAVMDNFFELSGGRRPKEIVWRDAAGRVIRTFRGH